MQLKDTEATAAPRTVGDLEAMLLTLLDALRYVHPDDCPGDIADAVEQMDGGSVATYGEVGMLSGNRGLELRFRNGAEYQLTIVQSQSAEVDESRCGLCGEVFKDEDDPDRGTGSDERAEMYDPDDEDADSVICHAQCGLSAGYEVA